MVRVIFVDPGGEEREVEADAGLSLMEAALQNGIDAIRADCGGACSCATCHVHVAPEWGDRLPLLSETENLMLEFVAGRDQYSRLSCQIDVTSDLDGLTVKLPEEP